MIHVLCPDIPHVSGGVGVLYRHVDILNSGSFSAAIVHQRPGFRAAWFASTTPVLYPPLNIRPDDILVFTELEGAAVGEQAKGIRKVIYCQTPYYMFRGYSLDPQDRRTPYTSKDMVGTVVVSEDARNYLNHVFPNLPVYRVRNSIDDRFRPAAEPRKRQICFMPRKHSDDAQQVINILKFRDMLEGWSIAPIHNAPEDDVPRIMRESMIFLSFGYPEGFGLPPAEAMACGCVVIGYHGNGGREYFTPQHGFPIEVGDIIGYARTVENVVHTLNRDAHALDEMTRCAAAFIRSTYTTANECADVLSCWNELMKYAKNM